MGGTLLFKLKTKTIFNLISIFAIMLCFFPSMVLPGDSLDLKADTKARSESLFFDNRPAAFSNLQIIASIDNPGPNTYKTVKFTLKTNTILRLYALGRGKSDKMLDYGGIEDSTTGQLIWIMRFLSTDYGDGMKEIRKVDRILPLRAGSYRLHFKTDTFQPSSNQITKNQDSINKGIWLFDETEHHKDFLDNFWETAISPEEFGWAGAKLNKLIPELEKFGTDALMVITNGKVVFEYGSTSNIIRSHSMRKSLLSALYGIYTANSMIDSTATLQQLEITESTSMTAQEKQATVLDLLKARSGVYIPAAAESSTMRKRRPQRGEHQPGTFWYYNNWDFNVLGTIFRHETGQDIYQAFKKDIADPIGMQDFILDRQAYYYQKKYSLHPAYPFLISARDMAKFGQLFLQQGRWRDNQIIPENWIAASTTSYSQTNMPGIGYGYMWWILTEDVHGLKKGGYFADGYGGQRLYVIPHINSVVVHRVNVKVPGTNVIFSELTPDAVIKRIMKAYTGKKNIQAKSKFKERKDPVVEKPLLEEYGRSSKYYGKSFKWFRTIFLICAYILTSGLVLWTLIYIVRRFFNRLSVPESNDGKGNLLAGVLKWTAAIGGLICSVYIFVILAIPYAFEYVALVGMPANLNLYQIILIHVPKFAVLLMFFLLIGSILSWTRQYWTIFERMHFVLITIAVTVFTSLAFRLDLIILM